MVKKILVVAGRSGSGKTSALQMLEDLGYYIIDNLPVSLVPDVVARLSQDHSMEQLAIGIDIRSLALESIDIEDILQKLNQYSPIDVLYLTAREQILIARYSSSRRPHPLSNRFDSLATCIAQEEILLADLARHATMTIDTSDSTVHQLQHTLSVKLGKSDKLVVVLQSFGFKHGLPLDADYVFDVRHLNNPHWVAELRPLSGLDEPVQQFLAADAMVTDMYQDIEQFLQKWLPILSQGHRHFVTVCVGCTGGQHRSVYLVEQLAKSLQQDWSVQVLHREGKHWAK
ncbi:MULTISPECIES: RNase adapter RapZ [unclassified Acinetobacter]|uniref:RNase adapter RapZ n=1 Tax=unclassified Acinetobacter TaxID=196816 RepID=UPI0035B6B799